MLKDGDIAHQEHHWESSTLFRQAAGNHQEVRTVLPVWMTAGLIWVSHLEWKKCTFLTMPSCTPFPSTKLCRAITPSHKPDVECPGHLSPPGSLSARRLLGSFSTGFAAKPHPRAGDITEYFPWKSRVDPKLNRACSFSVVRQFFMFGKIDTVLFGLDGVLRGLNMAQNLFHLPLCSSSCHQEKKPKYTLIFRSSYFSLHSSLLFSEYEITFHQFRRYLYSIFHI